MTDEVERKMSVRSEWMLACIIGTDLPLKDWSCVRDQEIADLLNYGINSNV